MQEKETISSIQLVLLIFFVNVATAVFFIPGHAVFIVGQDAWLATSAATIIAALITYYPLADLGKKYQGKSIIQYSETILGKYLGKALGIFLIYYFIQLHVWTIREFAEIIVVLLPGTPVEIIILVFSLVSSYTVYHGLEVIGRTGEFVFPIGFFLLGLVFFLSFQDLQLSNLQPIMESGLRPLLRATIYPLDWLTTGFVFGMLAWAINDTNKLGKIGLTAVVLSGLTLTLYSIFILASLGPVILPSFNFPLYKFASYARVGDFLESFESFIIIGWIGWIFVRNSLFSYISVKGFAQLFKLSDYRFLIFGETLLASAYSIYQYDSFVEMTSIFNFANPLYLLISLGIPLGLWLVSLFRTGRQQ